MAFRRSLWLVLLIPVLWVSLWRNLGAASLHTSDEACHTDVSRNMLMRGSWTDLWYFEDVYQGKPPLKMWLTAGLMSRLGQEEWVLRMPDAAFATVTMLLVWAVARRSMHGPAVLAAPFLFVTAPYPLVVHGWREGVQDSALTMLVTLAVLAYLHHRETESAAALVAMGAAVGAGAMVKSLAGFIVLLPIGLDLLARRKFRTILSASFVAAMVLAFAPFAMWHAPWFMSELYYNGYRRVVGWPTDAHPPSIYLTWLREGFTPWGPLLPVAVVVTVVQAVRRRGGFDAWLALWIAGLLAPWPAAHMKHPWYVYPAFPPLALALARTLLPPEAWGAAPGRAAMAVRMAGGALALAGGAFGLSQAWEVTSGGEVVELHRAVDHIKTIPAAHLAVAIEPRFVCPDERYYLDLSGADVHYVKGAAGAIPVVVQEPEAWVLLDRRDVPAFLRDVAPLRDLGVVEGVELWPRCRRVRGEGHLPNRMLLGFGKHAAEVSSPIPPVLYWSGFGSVEEAEHGSSAWLGPDQGRLWFPLQQCGTLHLRLYAFSRDNRIRVALPGFEGELAVPERGIEVELPLDVPLGGAMGTLDVLGGCISPAEVVPGSQDQRCLGVSVGQLSIAGRS